MAGGNGHTLRIRPRAEHGAEHGQGGGNEPLRSKYMQAGEVERSILFSWEAAGGDVDQRGGRKS